MSTLRRFDETKDSIGVGSGVNLAISGQSFSEDTVMRKTYDNPKALARPLAHYSNVVRLDLGTGGALLFLAGSVAIDAKEIW